MHPIIWISILVLGGFFVFRRLSRWEGADFTIKVSSRGQARIRGQIPGFTEAGIRSMVDDLQLPKGTRIVGLKDGGDWRVRASGVDKFTEQRIRNVMFTRLPR